MARGGAVKRWTWALVVLCLSLVVLWFVLDWMHKTFGTNIVGKTAGTLGNLGTGQAYTFSTP